MKVHNTRPCAWLTSTSTPPPPKCASRTPPFFSLRISSPVLPNHGGINSLRADANPNLSCGARDVDNFQLPKISFSHQQRGASCAAGGRSNIYTPNRVARLLREFTSEALRADSFGGTTLDRRRGSISRRCRRTRAVSGGWTATTLVFSAALGRAGTVAPHILSGLSSSRASSLKPRHG